MDINHLAKSKKEKGKGTDGGRRATYKSMKFKSKAKKRKNETCEVFEKDKSHVIVICTDSFSPDVRKYTRKIRKTKRKKVET